MKVFFNTLVLLIVFTFHNLHGQEDILSRKGSSSIYIGMTSPMEEFAEKDFFDLDDKDEGGAGIGMSIHYEYKYPLNETGLHLFAGLGVNYNPLQKEIISDFEEQHGGNDKFQATYTKYINIPLSVGINYTYTADDKLSVFGSFGIVSNFLYMTDFKHEYTFTNFITNESYDASRIVKFDTPNKFGYKIGGGIKLRDKYLLSLNFFDLGEYTIDTTDIHQSSNTYEFKYETERSIEFITVSFGIEI